MARIQVDYPKDEYIYHKIQRQVLTIEDWPPRKPSVKTLSSGLTSIVSETVIKLFADGARALPDASVGEVVESLANLAGYLFEFVDELGTAGTQNYFYVDPAESTITYIINRPLGKLFETYAGASAVEEETADQVLDTARAYSDATPYEILELMSLNYGYTHLRYPTEDGSETI